MSESTFTEQPFLPKKKKTKAFKGIQFPSDASSWCQISDLSCLTCLAAAAPACVRVFVCVCGERQLDSLRE